MDKANSIAINIIKSVLIALYKTFGVALIIAFVSMFLFLYATHHKWNKRNFLHNTLSVWLKNYKNDVTFRRTFFLIFYTGMILCRTLFNRDLWRNPLSNIMGDWALHKPDGTLSTEPIENLMLFIPFAMLLLWAFRKELLGDKVKFGKTVLKSTVAVGMFSLVIEISQLLFHLGTFQISDLVYNTLGGTVGGIFYFTVYKIRHRRK